MLSTRGEDFLGLSRYMELFFRPVGRGFGRRCRTTCITSLEMERIDVEICTMGAFADREDA